MPASTHRGSGLHIPPSHHHGQMMHTGHRHSFEIDMVHGPLLGKVLLFALPLMVSGVLQLLFNAADIVVVGRFTGPESIAAVGSNAALINLMISVFMGLSVGVNVQVAQFYGAGNAEKSRKVVQTAVSLSLLSGLILALIGVLFSRPILALMGTPENVIGLAASYLRIYFLGMPVIMLYNFGSAVLRGIGDTRRPLLYLSIAGAANVGMNLVFVAVFHLGVVGVALATVLSQIISAFLVLKCLTRDEGAVKLSLKPEDFKPDPQITAAIFRIGLPAGLQGSLFSLSNVIIQSSVNSFGSAVMAGNAAAQNLEGFVYISMNALMQASITFTSANYGAGDLKRVRRALFTCLGVVTVVGLTLGRGVAFFGVPLLGLYTTDPLTVQYGLTRLQVTCANYFLCGWMDTLTGAMRGIGRSVSSMIICLIGSCVLRIVWVMTVFQAFRSQFTLYISYPVSWLLTACVQLAFFFLAQRRDAAKFSEKAAAADVRAAQVPSGAAASSRAADTADSPDSKS